MKHMRRILLVLAVAALMAVTMSAPAAFAAGKGQTKVCFNHKGHIIKVGGPAAKAHLAHGDLPVPCPTS